MDLSAIETYTGPITTPRVLLACAAIYVLAFGPTLPRLLGRSKIRYIHARNSMILTLKNGTKTTFEQFCKSVIPPCNLNPLLFNGHLQTVWTAVAENAVEVYYKRWIFEQEDPAFKGTFAVDFVTKAYKGQVDSSLPPRTTYFTRDEFNDMGSDDTRPMLVTLHGLSGGSHELYLREVLGKLCLADCEWEACVVNSRGCAQSKLTSSILYNARSTWDVRQAVKFLRKRFPNRPLFGCGFSLGANIITNYIGEEGDQCEFSAAVVLSSPWNLELGNRALRRTWVGLNVYSTTMGSSMRTLFEKHVEQLSKNPNFDVPAIRKLRYLHDFDYLVQCRAWGYPTASAYYRDASSNDSLLNIRIPILAINAEDDPVGSLLAGRETGSDTVQIASHEALPYEEIQETPYGVLCATELGGHLSWFKFGGGRWFADATALFLQKMASEVDLSAIPKPPVTAYGLVDRQTVRKPLEAVFMPTRRKWHAPEQ